MKEWYNGLSKGKKIALWVAVVIVVGFIGDQAGWWAMSLPVPTEPVQYVNFINITLAFGPVFFYGY